MSQEELSVVFDSEFPLNQGKAQVAKLGHCSAGQREKDHRAIGNHRAAEPTIHHPDEQQSAYDIPRQSPDGTLNGLLWTDLRSQFVLSQGQSGEKGEGITGKAQDKGQQQVCSVDSGGFQAQESGKRVSDRDASEQPAII